MKQNHLLLSIGVVIILGITICFLQMRLKKETFDNVDNTEESSNQNEPLIQKQPLMQKSNGIGGDEQTLIFWRINENEKYPIKYFIVQYYEVTGNTRVIHSKLVPKNNRGKEYSTLIKGLKNNIQYLFQVVGVNKYGLGKVEEGNIIIPESGQPLFK